MTAFVLGNGMSRRGLDLNLVRSRGPVYGCNALYRDFTPDVLVATDRGMAQEIESTGYAQQHRFFTRRPTANSGAQVVPRPWYGYSSGPVALALAAKDGHSPIYLIGFDLGADHQGLFNNVYAGTSCYKPRNSGPTFTGNWIRQIQRVVRDHDHQSFVRVQGDITARVPEFDLLGNLAMMGLDQFVEWLNTAEEIS
jgi:hypothetical protein